MKQSITNIKVEQLKYFSSFVRYKDNKVVMRLGPDPSSYSRPDLVKISHIDLDWTVKFGENVLDGTATIKFLIIAKFIEEIVSDLELI